MKWASRKIFSSRKKVFFFTISILIFLSFAIFSFGLNRTKFRKSTEQLNSLTKLYPFLKSNFKTIDGNKLHYVFSSKKKKENLIVFIHGAPGAFDAFEKYLIDQDLLKVADLISVDRPGYGYSDYGKAITSIETQSKMISELTKDFDYENIYLVGHSFGGPIALFSGALIEKTKHTFLLAPTLDPSLEKFELLAKTVLSFPFKYFASPANLVSSYEKISHRKELENISEIYKEIKNKVTIIHGNKDWLVPIENIIYLEKKLDKKQFESVILDGKSHFFVWEDLGLVKDYLFKVINNNAEHSN